MNIQKMFLCLEILQIDLMQNVGQVTNIYDDKHPLIPHTAQDVRGEGEKELTEMLIVKPSFILGS